MKHIILTLFSLTILLGSCGGKKETKNNQTKSVLDTTLEIPNTIDQISTLEYNSKTSIWTMNGEAYSGYAISNYPNNKVKVKIGILNGKKENQSMEWYPDGHLRQIANYHRGNLHGEKKVWSSDAKHVLISQFNYKAGLPHGKQKQWYFTGELHKILQLNMGKEEGIQQAFRKNGDLYANYEAKNGRIFGMNKGMLCYGLKDENIQYNE